jgi:DNA polymerase-1
MTKRVLLIDGDMVAYRVAAAEEKPLDFGETFILSADAENGRKNLDAMIEHFMEKLEADSVLLAFTADDNYRKVVMPSYKSNREGVRRPMILKAMRDHCVSTYETATRPTLEADDVLGIMATHPGIMKGQEKVIVTWDKDLRTIPGLHWNPTNDADTGIVEVSLRGADNAFYAQVLSGDAVDGYPGCPNIGKKRAEQIVVSRTQTYPHEEEIKRGPNAGTMRTLWKLIKNPDPWACIVSHYEKAGLTEADALQTAQVARILRAEDYNFKTKEPILWQPKSA